MPFMASVRPADGNTGASSKMTAAARSGRCAPSSRTMLPPHAVPDQHAVSYPESIAEPAEIFHKHIRRICAVRLMAFSVATQVHGDYPMRGTEMSHLRREAESITRPAMDQQHRWLAASRLLEGARHAISYTFHLLSRRSRATERLYRWALGPRHTGV